MSKRNLSELPILDNLPLIELQEEYLRQADEIGKMAQGPARDALPTGPLPDEISPLFEDWLHKFSNVPKERLVDDNAKNKLAFKYALLAGEKVISSLQRLKTIN